MNTSTRFGLAVFISALVMIGSNFNLGAQTIAQKIQYVYLINDSSAELNIKATRTINSMDMTYFGTDSAHADSYFCFGMGCFGSTQDESPYEAIPGCSADQTFMAYFFYTIIFIVLIFKCIRS